MLQSVLVYCLLALLMIVCGFIAARRECLYYYQVDKLNTSLRTRPLGFLHCEIWLPILFFAIIFGCRYNVGVDYPHYLEDYLYGFDREYEFLFRIISQGMASAGIHYAFYFTLWAFIQIFLLYYTFRNYRFLFPYLAFFLIFGSYYLSMMNIIRQQLAACIFLFSIQYIEKKQTLKYYLCVLLAFCFHKSAVLLIPIYPLFVWKKDWFANLKIQLLLYCIAFYLSFKYDLVVNLFSGAFNLFSSSVGYENYMEGILYNETLNDMTKFGNNTGLGIYVSVFLSLPIIIYSKKLKSFYNSNFFLIFYSLWFVRIMADFMVGDSIVLNRPFVYVYDVKIFILACFVYYCFATKKIFNYLLGWSFIILHILLFMNILSNGEVNTSKFLFFWQFNNL